MREQPLSLNDPTLNVGVHWGAREQKSRSNICIHQGSINLRAPRPNVMGLVKQPDSPRAPSEEGVTPRSVGGIGDQVNGGPPFRVLGHEIETLWRERPIPVDVYERRAGIHGELPDGVLPLAHEVGRYHDERRAIKDVLVDSEEWRDCFELADRPATQATQPLT